MSDSINDGDSPFKLPTIENPPPQRSVSVLVGPLDEDEDFWQYESQLLVRRGTRMPDRCVVCNEPAEPKQLHCVVRRRITEAPVILAVLVLFPFWLIVLTLGHQSAQLWPGLCTRHRKREVRGRRFTIALMLLGFALPFAPFFLVTNPLTGMSVWIVWCLIAGCVMLCSSVC